MDKVAPVLFFDNCKVAPVYLFIKFLSLKKKSSPHEKKERKNLGKPK